MRKAQFPRRLAVALVLVPSVLCVTYLGGWVFCLAVLAATLLAGHEFFELMRKGGFAPFEPAGLATIALFVLSTFRPQWQLLRPGLTSLLIISLVWQLFQSHARFPTADWALTMAGGLYVGWLAGHFPALRMLPNGYTWTMLLFLITWAGDSGAYFVGLKSGRRPLWPRLSPRKTWEGAIGGWLCGVAAGLLLGTLAGVGPLHGLALGAIISTLAPFGDLAVSMIKRQVGVKDSGNLIPGHGGMLDRIDSLLFTVAGAFYYVNLVVY